MTRRAQFAREKDGLPPCYVLSEFAKHIGMTGEQVKARVKRGTLPKPDAQTVSGWNVWYVPTVQQVVKEMTG